MQTRFVRVLAMSIILVVASVPSAAFAQRDRGPFDGYGFVSSYYDNNVFSYSDQDRDLYDSGVTTGGKFPIESLGDLVTTLALRGDYRWDVKRRSMWRLRLLYDGTLYANNTDRNYSRFGASLDRIMRKSQASLSVNYTPEYYLRNLYWRPMPERPAGVLYAAAVYNRFVVTAKGDRRLSRTVDGNALIGFARRDYDFPFDERDNNTYMFGAGADVKITKRFNVSFGLKMDISSASGADSTNQTVDDISNNRYGMEVSGTWRVARRILFVQSVDYGHQVYKTSNVADLSHHDRKDDEITLASELSMMPTRGWQPELYFQYRASTSTVPPGIAELGQYKAFRVGLQVTHYF